MNFKNKVGLIILALILVALVSLPGQAFAENYNRYYSTTDVSKDEILSLIGFQSFDSATSASKVEAYINHFINNTDKYVRVTNQSSGSDVGQDNKYTTKLIWGGRGCFHYAQFVSQTIYNSNDFSYDSLKLERNGGVYSKLSLIDFLESNAQSGEHIRVDPYHSLVYLGSNGEGIFTVQFGGDDSSPDPFISFMTYDYLTNLLNHYDKDFILYNYNKTKNSNVVDINKNGLITENGDTYYYKDGKKQVGWQYINDKWYFFDTQNGYMRTGWINYKNAWYFLDRTDGSMQTGWQNIDNRWYYLDPVGYMRTGWLKSSNAWYYLDTSNGHMITGWKNINGAWYYLNTNGVMKTGWLQYNGDWYFLDRTQGSMKIGWQLIDDEYYYFNESGTMRTGWVKANGSWYYLDSVNGHMLTGWIIVGDETYYLDEVNGHMLTGWIYLDDEMYYMDDSGAMLKDGFYEIDGYEYEFDSHGRLVN